VLGAADAIVGPLDTVLPVDLRIPGCPPTPEVIAQALLELIDAR
jgi:NADH:ubiquinone oxidoreductase subunit B-like Fe-S oxidoreductase